jgi:hypothetical protein
VRKLLILVVAAAGAGYALWRRWELANQPVATVWAEGTDPLR